MLMKMPCYHLGMTIYHSPRLHRSPHVASHHLNLPTGLIYLLQHVEKKRKRRLPPQKHHKSSVGRVCHKQFRQIIDKSC